MKANDTVKLRIATVSDAEALAEIYDYYVKHTAISFEYDAPDAGEFASRITHKLEKYPFLVAEQDGKAVGYAYASELRERAAYAWDAELSIYVKLDRRGLGIGTRLYSALIDVLRIQNFATVYGCITYPNEASVSLHEKMGFDYAGRFRTSGYKCGRWHDVLWYEKRINDISDFPSPPTPFSQIDEALVNKILSRY